MFPIQSIPWIPLLLGAFSIYAVVVAVWLILENRSPQSTFAWLFLLLLFPIIGVLIYFFVGRGVYAFSREDELMRQALGMEDEQVIATFRTGQQRAIAQLAQRDPELYQEKLLNLVLNNTSSLFSDHNEVALLQNASEKYPRLLADIRAAHHAIHMAYYIWEEDKFTIELKDLLLQKADEGCQIRILVDAQGLAVSRGYLREMRAGGIQMYTYYNFLAPFKLHTVSYRNHRKIVIIDNAIGYMGGLNMSQEHLDGGKHFDSWRDTHLRIEGEVVQILQGIFLTSWYNTTDEKLDAVRYMAAEPEPAIQPNAAEPEPAVQPNTAVPYLPIQITTSGPDSKWRAIRQLYFLMIMAAKQHLYIQSPFFIPDESILEALKAAALAGVDVKLMFAPRGTSYSIPYWAANTYFVDVVKAGARVFLYQKGYFHPKTVSVDSTVCSIGTANMDIRSFSINYEVNAIIYDKKIAQQLEADFENDLEDCIEFTVADYESRNVLRHVRDSLSRLASPLL